MKHVDPLESFVLQLEFILKYFFFLLLFFIMAVILVPGPKWNDLVNACCCWRAR